MRDRRLELAGGALILFAGAAVWLMHHPETGIVDRAARWPLIGPAASAFIVRFRSPQAEVPPLVDTPIPAEPVPEYHYRIRGAGSPGRPVVDHLPRLAVEPDLRRFASGDELEPVLPLVAMPADPRQMEGALARLASDRTRHRLGAYKLQTDHEGIEEILMRWRPVIADSERAWSERYGVEPLGEAAETIILFSRGDDFLAFARESGVTAIRASGFSSRGVVVLAAEGKLAEELDGSLQHELGHLLARRSIGPALPPWLAEGLAEDFGEAPLGGDGRLDFDRVRGAVLRQQNRFEIRGGLAMLDRAGRRAASGSPPALGALTGDVDDGIVDDGMAPDLYADAFAWIRFLLSEPETARGFRGFLAAVREGGAPTLAALDKRLPRSLAELAPRLALWLLETRRRELVANGAPPHLPDAAGVVSVEEVSSSPEG